MRFPSPSLPGNLSQTYFENIHPQYPILHKPTFQKWEDQYVKANLEVDQTLLDEPSIFFVLMVYAIGALVENHYDVAMAYYSGAMEYMDSLLSVDNLTSIQCVLCCATFSIRSPVGVSVWKTIGMALRHCIEMGLHQHTTGHYRNADTLEQELSKRCFWVAYNLDHALALTLGLPLGISDDAIDVDLPMDVDDEAITPTGFLRPPRADSTSPPTLTTGFILSIKLRRLWSKISDCLYPQVQPLTRTMSTMDKKGLIQEIQLELEEWYAEVQSHEEDPATHSQSLYASGKWFQLEYLRSLLLIHRHCLTPDRSSALGLGTQPAIASDLEIEDSMETCAIVSSKLCFLFREVHEGTAVQITWSMVHVLFSTGLTYLGCLWKSKRVRGKAQEKDISATLEACLKVLAIAEDWHPESPYRQIFEKLAQRTMKMVSGDDVDPPFRHLPSIGAVNEAFQDESWFTLGGEMDLTALQDWDSWLADATH
ncbi:fungal specific transcription factor [Colletotrichum kahawae]|uniref:Fungal specific transcription factor n=1 Tax=Colletotrichum kahawae TaxID=34407 RepID=A0AAD9YJH9_COLKA|nr:fungal specific transcription factor [Colletotrichum kahawae]